MTETAPPLSAKPSAKLFNTVRAMTVNATSALPAVEAERMCRDALAQNPDDIGALAGLGYIAFLWDDLDTASDLLTRAVTAAEAAELPAADRAEMWFHLGHVHGTRNDSHATETAYRTAVSLAPRHLDAMNSLGLFLRHEKRFAEAEAAFAAIIDIKPTHAGAIRRQGTVRLMTGDLDGAEACFRRALEVKPDYIEAFINLGEVMEARGDRDAALDAYRTAASIKYDFAPSHQMLGDLLARMGRTEEAAPLLTRAVALKSWHADPHRSLIRMGHRW